MEEKQIPFHYNVIKSKMVVLRILDFEKSQFVLLSHSHWLRKRCDLEQKIISFPDLL